jgi:hypothetical protein
LIYHYCYTEIGRLGSGSAFVRGFLIAKEKKKSIRTFKIIDEVNGERKWIYHNDNNNHNILEVA